MIKDKIRQEDLPQLLICVDVALGVDGLSKIGNAARPTGETS